MVPWEAGARWNELIRGNFPLWAFQSSPVPASDFAQVCENTNRSILLGSGAPERPKAESYSEPTRYAVFDSRATPLRVSDQNPCHPTKGSLGRGKMDHW